MFHGIVPVIDAEAGIQRIRTNTVNERITCERRRQTRVVGCVPDGNSSLMLVCARPRHVAGTQWGNKKYRNMKHLGVPFLPDDGFIYRGANKFAHNT